jgi:hypothetical protein
MARRMADPSFRERQWQHRYHPHVAPINQFVDSLRTEDDRGWAPYVAPMYGGVEARLLSVLRDPGPKTRDESGSGFLCMENDDATAEAIADYFCDAGIDARDILPWNAYPWYINRKPKAAELSAGVDPLRRIIDLLPRLQVVMLHGGSAHSAWRRLKKKYPHQQVERGLEVIETYHTSRQAFWHPDPEVRETRRRHLRDAFQRGAQLLRGAQTRQSQSSA